MKKTLILLTLILLSGHVFAQARERVLKIERSRDGLFKGEIRNAKLQDVAAMLSTKTGPKIEVDESIKEKVVRIPYKFENVDTQGLLQALTSFRYSEEIPPKYRKVKGENKYIIEPMGVNTSSEDITEDDLAEYYDTTTKNPEPNNTKHIVFQNGRVISGKLIPTSQRQVGEKWVVIKDGTKYTKTVEEILPGRKIEFIDRELLFRYPPAPAQFAQKMLEKYISKGLFNCKIKKKYPNELFLLEIPEKESMKDIISKFRSEPEGRFCQPYGISPMTITLDDLKAFDPGHMPGSGKDKNNRYRYRPGYIKIKFKQRLSYIEICIFANKYALHIEGTDEYMNEGYFYAPNNEDTLDIVNKIRSDSLVLNSDPEGIISGFDFPADPPNDALYASQWSLQADKLDALTAWQTVAGRNLNNQITVAVIDSGYWSGHGDLPLAMENRLNLPVKLDDGSFTPFYAFPDGINFVRDSFSSHDQYCRNRSGQYSHGTIVAGLIGARTNNNYTGIAGLAGYSTSFNTSFNILPLKISCRVHPDSPWPTTPYFTTNTHIRQAILYCAGERQAYGDEVIHVPPLAQIINLSWGDEIYDQDIRNAINTAIEKGCLVVAAAGNYGHSLDVDPVFPAAYTELITVAATTQNDLKWSQSNYGTKVDVSAPGDNIYTTTFTWDSTNDTRNPPYYQSGWSGTSYSAPLVAGVAALMLAKEPVLPISRAEVDILSYRLSKSLYKILPPTMGMGRGIVSAEEAVNNTEATIVSLSFQVEENANRIEVKVNFDNTSNSKVALLELGLPDEPVPLTISFTRIDNQYWDAVGTIAVPTAENSPDVYRRAAMAFVDTDGNTTIRQFTYKVVPVRAAYPYIAASDNSLYTRALAKGFEPFFTNDFTMSKLGIPDTLPIPHGNLTKTAKEWVRYGALLEGGGVD